MKKILFPFYNKERHGFLMNKWWFRLGIVIYILALFWVIYQGYYNTVLGPYEACLDKAIRFDVNMSTCDFHLNYSVGILASLFYLISFHYSVQLIWFKVIVDFIALGSKESSEDKD